MTKTIYLVFLLLMVSVGAHAQLKTVSDSTVEEKMIRAAYAKLERYNRAAELMDMGGMVEKVRDDSVLKFELKNFHTGSIDQIKNLRISEVSTQANGEIIQVSRGKHTMNNGTPEAYYSARWWKNDAKERDWTFAELMPLLASEYFDVGHYTSYDVTVSFEGRTRSYKALVLHHDLGERSVDPRPTFWDAVGTDGQLEEVWGEKLPPYGSGMNKNVTTPD